VLDVGCGDTFVVEQLALANPLASCYALDTAFTDELLAHYRAQLQAPNVFVSSSLDAITPPLDHAVSLVLLMDVLEHIADDEGFLTTLLAHPAILPETRIFVTVPSYQSLFGSHDVALGHYRRYSNRRLRRLLEVAGLTVLDIGYLFSSLLPLRAFQVMKERVFDGRAGVPTSGLSRWKGGAGLTAAMRRLLLIDCLVTMQLRRVGLTLPGLSNYAICRKSA
jgi:methyltransferase family protein